MIEVLTEGKLTPSIRRIEEKFGRPAVDVVGEVAQAMTVQQMRQYLGVSNPTYVMRDLGIEGRGKSAAHKATWADPEKKAKLLDAIRSPQRITQHRKSLAITNDFKTDEERRAMVASANEVKRESRLAEMKEVFGPQPYKRIHALTRQGLGRTEIAAQYDLSVKKLRGWVNLWVSEQGELDEIVNWSLWRAVVTMRLKRRIVAQGLMTREEIGLLKGHFCIEGNCLKPKDPIFEKLSYAVAKVVSVQDENMAAGIVNSR